MNRRSVDRGSDLGARCKVGNDTLAALGDPFENRRAVDEGSDLGYRPLLVLTQGWAVLGGTAGDRELGLRRIGS